jgi:NAD(P)-dependent dehydrogenase (short-subunit alcohol dehydrogenase family)
MVQPVAPVSNASDPVVLVTGASAGIGAACARVFHAAGYRVAACSNDHVAGAELQEELNRLRTSSTRFFDCDVRDPRQIADTVSAAFVEFGRLDVLINNVGVSCASKTADDYTLDEIDDLIKVNLLSCILTTGAALPHIRRSKGAIVCIGSISGSIGHDRVSLYCATKAAVAAFAKGVAIDEVQSGVRVNTVLPGNIMTTSRERLEGALNDPKELHEFIESWQWMGRSGTAEEVANVCLFLASDKASFVTGTEIIVSGGTEIGSGPKLRTTVGKDGRITTSPRPAVSLTS